jgi:hypothetical protein
MVLLLDAYMGKRSALNRYFNNIAIEQVESDVEHETELRTDPIFGSDMHV